jgi:hypothetical protein
MEIPVLDSAIDIAEFITYAWQQTVSHIEWDGKKWYPWTTSWTGTKETRGDHDPDFPCHGYYEHALVEDEEDGDAYEEAAQAKMSKKQPKDISEIRHRFDHEDSRHWYGSDKVVLRNKWFVQNPYGGINDDHRGSNHLALDLDRLYIENVEIEPGTYTVLDLLDLLWRTKGNKFNNQYELFCRLFYPMNSPPTPDEEENHWTFARWREEGNKKGMLATDRHGNFRVEKDDGGSWSIELSVDHGS